MTRKSVGTRENRGQDVAKQQPKTSKTYFLPFQSVWPYTRKRHSVGVRSECVSPQSAARSFVRAVFFFSRIFVRRSFYCTRPTPLKRVPVRGRTPEGRARAFHCCAAASFRPSKTVAAKRNNSRGPPPPRPAPPRDFTVDTVTGNALCLASAYGCIVPMRLSGTSENQRTKYRSGGQRFCGGCAFFARTRHPRTQTTHARLTGTSRTRTFSQ